MIVLSTSQSVSDFLITLMEQYSKNVTEYDKDLIRNYFNDPYFFEIDSITLHNCLKLYLIMLNFIQK